MTVKKLTRKQIEEGLSSIPVSDILGAKISRALTPKQRAFAMGVAKGKTKADAYREAYPNAQSQRTLAVDPYRLASDPRIVREMEAYTLAIEAAKHRTPAALRELVIQSLVSVVIDPDAKQSVRVAAAKVLGTVTEVAAFTERKEVRTITSSADTRARIMGELRQMMSGQIEDATTLELQAGELMAELAGSDTHPPGTPQAEEAESRVDIHTIPPEQSPTPSIWEDPPTTSST